MNTAAAQCDGCGAQFHSPDDANIIGIQPDGEAEVLYHFCGTCTLGLADHEKGQAIEARANASATRRSTSGVLAV